MELLLIQLVIVVFLLAYMYGEEASTVNNTYIFSKYDAPPEVWQVYADSIIAKFDAAAAARSDQWYKEDIADGLTWSADVGPVPAEEDFGW